MTRFERYYERELALGQKGSITNNRSPHQFLERLLCMVQEKVTATGVAALAY